MSASLSSIISHYPIFQSLVSQINALDLYNLSLTSKQFYNLIYPAPATFSTFAHFTLCVDGAWNYDKRLYKDSDPEPSEDEYPIKCENINVRRCERCFVNVCMACRYHHDYEYRNDNHRDPHYTPGSYQLENMIYFCEECDEDVEMGLLEPVELNPKLSPTTGLEAEIDSNEAQEEQDEWCKCDRKTRCWCQPCFKKHQKSWWEYADRCTKMMQQTKLDGQMLIGDHQEDRAVSGRPAFLINAAAIDSIECINWY